MKNFFDPQSVAIIGASDQEGKIGNILLQNLLDLSFPGKIYPVNPKYPQIGQLVCFSSVKEIHEPIDLAIIAIPAALVPQAVQECAQKQQPIKNIIIISAGFGESGSEGKQLEQQISELAAQNDLKILGPNCLGTVNAGKNYNFSFAKNNFLPGKIGLVMQSGAFTTALFDLAAGESFGFSLVSTLGNKAVLDEVDFLEYFSQDEQTKLIAMYLEDIKRGKIFYEKLKAISAKKPVLVLKAGNSQKSQAAIQSHTGAMAGQAAVAKEAVLEAGGLFFEDLTDFITTLKIFHNFKQPKNNQIAIVTNAGGPGVVMTDLVEKADFLQLADFSSQEKEKIKKQLPPASAVNNPIDVLGDADEKRYAKVLKMLDQNKNLGAVLAIVTPQAQTNIKKIARVLLKANEKYDFPILPVVIGFQADQLAKKVFKNSLANFVYPLSAVTALDQMFGYAARLAQQTSPEEILVDEARKNQAAALAASVKSQSRSVFFYQEARELADLYQLPTVDENKIEQAADLENLALEFPWVMKVDSPNLLHKNVKGGVLLNLQSQLEAKIAWEKLRKDFPTERIIVQNQVQSGLEIILGLKKDENFGQVMMLGLGGIMTEIIDEKFLWIGPATKEQVAKKIKNSKIEKVFQKQKIPLEVLLEEVRKVSQMAQENEWIQELDINPIIFYPQKNPVAVDIKVLL